MIESNLQHIRNTAKGLHTELAKKASAPLSPSVKDEVDVYQTGVESKSEYDWSSKGIALRVRPTQIKSE